MLPCCHAAFGDVSQDKGGAHKKVIEASDGSEHGECAGRISYMNTLMRYYLHIDPDSMSDEEWALTFAQLCDIRRREAEAVKKSR